MAHAYEKTLLAQLGFQDPDRGTPEHDMACRYLAEPSQMQKLADALMPKVWVKTRGIGSCVWTWPRLDPLVRRMAELGMVIDSGKLYFSLPRSGRKYEVSEYHKCLYGVGGGEDGKKITDAFEIVKEEAFVLISEFRDGKSLWHASGEPVKGPCETIKSSWRATDAWLEHPLNKGNGAYKTTVGFADLIFAVEESNLTRTCVTNPDNTKTVDDTWRVDRFRCFLVEVKARPVCASAILRQLKLYAEYMNGHIASNRDQFGGYAVFSDLSDLVMVAATLYPMPASDRAMLRSQGVHTIRLGEPFQAWLAEQRALPANESPDEVF